jgi:hypothetical protein
MKFLNNKHITTTKIRLLPGLAFKLGLIKTNKFSTSNRSRSENINYLYYLAEKISSTPAARVNNINNITRLTDKYTQDWSMFYLTPDILEIQLRLDSTISELRRGEHIMDHYYTILEYAKPLEYGNLDDINVPIIFTSDGLTYYAQYLDIDRMFRGYEFYFSGLYGEFYHLLQQNNLLTEKSYSELAVLVKQLDKQYYIFKHILDDFKQSRNEYIELLDEKKQIDNIYTEFDYIIDIFFYRGYVSDLNHSIITDCINISYLSELPFFLDSDLQQRILALRNDNIIGFSELPYSNLQDLSPDLEFIIDPDNISYDHNIYLQGVEFHNNLIAFNELPYSNMEETQISPEEDNLAALQELPFSNYNDDQYFAEQEDNFAEQEDNLAALQELPFCNPDDDTFELDDHGLDSFIQLPTSNIENNITNAIDAVLELVDSLS